MLQLDPDKWMRPHDESPEQLKQYLKEFLIQWEPFDFTINLE